MIVEYAATFSRRKHKGQTYNGQPYYKHPYLVARIIRYLCPLDYELQAAAYLHDILEDTDMTPAEFLSEFGQPITSLVYEVTKDKHGNFPNLVTQRGLLLKLADRIANVMSLPVTEFSKQEKIFRKYSSAFIYEGDNIKKHE